MVWQLTEFDQKVVRMALEEDLGRYLSDLTTDTLLPSALPRTHAEIYVKEKTPIIVSGIAVACAVFQAVDATTTFEITADDGASAKPGDTLVRICAAPQILLHGERTALNFLRHLCAVATLTKKFVLAVEGTRTRILDTRKTTPTQRRFEKHAVMCGGGVNHRLGLYDAVLIKNNHVDLCGGMDKALNLLSADQVKKTPVVVEVRSIAELQAVLKWGRGKVSRVLLDNMTPQDLKTCVEMCAGILETEASGNITLSTMRAVAESGVDFASVGQLTYAAGNVDLSMRIAPASRGAA